MPIHTAYVRYHEDFPLDINGGSAAIGFNNLGVKVIPFQGLEDVEVNVDCGPEALVSGYICDVKAGLRKLGLPMPAELDYPEELEEFYGRNTWTGTLKGAREWPLSMGPVFLKPQTQKLFTGFVWTGSKTDRLRIATHGDDVPVFFSDPIDFISEARCYILDGEVLDVKRYKGSYSVGPEKSVVEAAVSSYKGPRAYAIDFGVTAEGKTLVVEVNDGFAIGNYGLHPIAYARMIETRWNQLVEPLIEGN